MKIRNKKGQSALEYIILVTGVLVVVILFLGPDGLFQTKVTETYTTVTDEMGTAAGKLTTAFNPEKSKE